MSGLLSTRGRIGRGRYAAITLVIALVSYAFAFVIGSMGAASDGDLRSASLMGLLVLVLGSVVQAMISVQRLHDLGRPGRHIWFMLIPFYNIYFSLVLCFTPGSNDSNRRVPSPA